MQETSVHVTDGTSAINIPTSSTVNNTSMCGGVMNPVMHISEPSTSTMETTFASVGVEDSGMNVPMPLSSIPDPSANMNDPEPSAFVQEMHPTVFDETNCSSINVSPFEYSDNKKKKQSPTKKFLRRKVKILQQKVKRLEKKINNLESLLHQAKQFGDMSDETLSMLKNSFGELPFNILINQLQNSNRKPQGRRYTSSMKQFALTLYFYSHRSYNYLRERIHLPDDASIRSWICSYNCYPGFLEEAFKFLSNLTLKEAKFEDCALIIDSMSIRKQVVWDNARNKFCGYVECVGLVDGKEECLASEALVFLIVSLTHKFKCPVAYFLIDKLSTNVLSQLISICIGKLHDINIRVWSVTADGLATNVSAFETLGCQLNGRKAADIQSYFFHPCSDKPIYVIMDPCHMIKLARNVLAEKQLSSEKGNISWHYLRELNKLQSEIGFNFSNKLSGAHVNYKNKKMNVALASQTLSRSTSDALEFLCKLNDRRFVGAEATIEYMRFIDRTFDLLNSRNPFGKEYKTPLNLRNQNWSSEVFQSTIAYLENLKLDNLPVLKTPRKMFALGFIISMKSIQLMANDLLNKHENPLKYFLTYKVSQDHLELFFNSIRGCGGYNNNPNACQFRWALRKLLLAKNISAVNSNCLKNNVELPSSILEFRSPKRAIADANNDKNEILAAYTTLLDKENLSYYQSNILNDIGGYIVKGILKKCTCIDCFKMLLDNSEVSHNYSQINLANPKSFVTFRSRGKLTFCSSIVFKIVCAAEKAFKLLVIKEKRNIKVNHEIIKISSEFLRREGIKFQHEISNEFAYEDLHESQMTKKIIEVYLKIRLKFYGKTLTLKYAHNNTATIRQKFNKLVHFRNV